MPSRVSGEGTGRGGGAPRQSRKMDITLIVVTLLSLALAVIMSGIAWRLTRQERRRSEARVAALAVEIHSAGAPRTITNDLPSPEVPVAVSTSSDLFAAARPGASSGSRLAAVFALGVFVVGSSAALAVVLSSVPHGVANSAALVGSGLSRTPRTDIAGSGSSRTPRTMLELTALGHERDADRLTVRGVVRNPPSGSEVGRLTAVVFLFNRDGGFLASGRAAVDATTLTPGAESPFVVTVPGAADVGRYRVSFRTDEGIVPHVDRRDRK